MNFGYLLKLSKN